MINKIIKKIFNKLGFKIERINTQINAKIIEEIKNDPVNDYFKLKKEFLKLSTKKIHFGCGPRVLKNWINIDLSYEPYEKYLESYGDKFYPPEIRGDKTDLFALDITQYGLPIPDCSIDVIFHEDFLEHLNQRNQIVFLAEALRVLKKGGVHRVNTPNILSSMQEHSDFSKGISGVYLDEWDKWHHLNLLSPQSLIEMALMVGYSSVSINSRDQSLAKALLPFEYRPGFDRTEDGNIFADLIK